MSSTVLPWTSKYVMTTDNPLEEPLKLRPHGLQIKFFFAWVREWVFWKTEKMLRPIIYHYLCDRSAVTFHWTDATYQTCENTKWKVKDCLFLPNFSVRSSSYNIREYYVDVDVSEIIVGTLRLCVLCTSRKFANCSHDSSHLPFSSLSRASLIVVWSQRKTFTKSRLRLLLPLNRLFISFSYMPSVWIAIKKENRDKEKRRRRRPNTDMGRMCQTNKFAHRCTAQCCVQENTRMNCTHRIAIAII